jgi:DNA-binding NtrC family response regulator
LRERPGDLPLLLKHFIQRFARPGTPAPSVAPAAWAVLLQHRFPGNVRELSHAVEHAMVLSGGKDIDVTHLPPGMVGAASPETDAMIVPDAAALQPLAVALREFEHQYLTRALKAGDGKRTRTASMLGISRKTLWEKLRNGGVELPDDEPASEELPH